MNIFTEYSQDEYGFTWRYVLMNICMNTLFLGVYLKCLHCIWQFFPLYWYPLNSCHFLWSYCGMLHLAKGYKILWLKLKKKKYVYLLILRKKTLAILGPKCTLLEDVIFKLWTIEIHAKAPFLWGFSPSLYTCRSHSFEMLIFSHDALGWQKDKLTALKCQLSWQAHSISMQCLHSTV